MVRKLPLRKAKWDSCMQTRSSPVTKIGFLCQSAFPQGKPSSQSTRGMLGEGEFCTHTPQLGEGTRHMLDKTATMVVPLQRWAKLTGNAVLLTWDEPHTCFGHLEKRRGVVASSHILFLILSFQGMRNKGCLNNQGGSNPSSWSSCSVPSCPLAHRDSATTPGQGWDCFFWG